MDFATAKKIWLRWNVALTLMGSGEATPYADLDDLDTATCQQRWRTAKGVVFTLSFVDAGDGTIVKAQTWGRDDSFCRRVDVATDDARMTLVEDIVRWADEVRYVAEWWTNDGAFDSPEDDAPFKVSLHHELDDVFEDFFGGHGFTIPEKSGVTAESNAGYALWRDVPVMELRLGNDARRKPFLTVKAPFMRDVALRREHRDAKNGRVWSARVHEIDTRTQHKALSPAAQELRENSVFGAHAVDDGLVLQRHIMDAFTDEMPRLDRVAEGAFELSFPERRAHVHVEINDHPESYAALTVDNVGVVWSGSLGGTDFVYDDEDFEGASNAELDGLLDERVRERCEELVDVIEGVDGLMTFVVEGGYGVAGRVDVTSRVASDTRGVIATLANVLEHRGDDAALAKAVLGCDVDGLDCGVPNPAIRYEVASLKAEGEYDVIDVNAVVDSLERVDGEWRVRWTKHVTVTGLSRAVLEHVARESESA